ncbi:MAG: family 20 glycosylhydrolase, partial [Armatimonadota bacterium]|nr:family 20 glycosylhydrolase [Armatimonadota bacterium]
MRSLFAVVFLLGMAARGAVAQNLLLNGGFDTLSAAGFAEGWAQEIHTAEGAEGTLSVEEGALRIHHASNNAAWVRASQQPVPARPERPYTLRCRARGDAPGLVVVYEYLSAPQSSPPISHSFAFPAPGEVWTPLVLSFRTGPAATYFKVSLIATGQGVLWFDDVHLRDLAERPAAVIPAAPASARLEPFLLLNGDGKESAHPVSAAVSYDAENLRIHFECAEPQPDRLTAKQGPGGLPYLDDCVEIFLQPPGWEGGHCQVVVNTIGTVWAHRSGGVGLFRSWWAPAFQPGPWQPRVSATARVAANHWSAEVLIPWQDLEMKPRAGVELRANFTRRRLVDGEENASWALMRGTTFIDPTQWGRLIIGADGTSAALRLVRARRKPQPLPQVPAFRTPNPVFALRALHTQAPLRSEVEEYKHLVRVLRQLRFNTLVMEVNERLKYQRRPEIAAPDALSKEEMRELVRYCRNLGFEVIPQVQTLGHFNYVLRHHPELAENREPHPQHGLWSACPSNPAVYELEFDLFSEVIEVFQPKQFHIGHDEFTFVPVGVCERCRGTSPADLLVRDVTTLHDWLTRRGLKVLMWGDTLLEDQYGGPRYYNTYLALPRIPRDIVIYDWHYRPDERFPSVKLFRNAGFEVVVCGWFNPLNIQNLAREGMAAGAQGYCFTTWYGVGRIATTAELMAAAFLSAHFAWDPRGPGLERFPV